MKIMIPTWQITLTQNIKLKVEASSLDEVTRQLPDGYYSTFRTFDQCTRVLSLKSHLRRLYEPVSTPEVDESFLRRQLRVLLEPCPPGEARVRAVMTKQGQVYVAIEPLKLLPSEIYEKGVTVVTTELHRQHPRLKSTTFIGRSDSERKHIAQEGIFEALLIKDGKILEGMTSNFFYVVGRDARSVPPYVGTAGDDVLMGITRQTVIDVAQEMGLELSYEPLKQAQIAAIEEAFITSSSRGVVPIIKIDDVAIGQGRPGQITRQLIASYEAYVIQNAEKIL
jgi:branched-chain amino acid aminotransferase